MKQESEGLYASVSRELGEKKSVPTDNLQFALACNGYMLHNDRLLFIPTAAQKMRYASYAQRVSFFGPTATNDFYSTNDYGAENISSSLAQQSVDDVIGKYREIDDDQAARIAFTLGGLARHYLGNSTYPHTDKEMTHAKKAVDFVARMGKLGGAASGDAVVNAMAMYCISKGSFETDSSFVAKVYKMTDAIENDPVMVSETSDLGLSQLARLRNFLGDSSPLPDIQKDRKAFNGFPTVGAEFHFPIDVALDIPNLWQRLAILNMSQYQKESYIQLSRNDKDIVEVRMNPSIYPVTLSNWNYIRLLLPEINHATFFATFNRPEMGSDFAWEDPHDKELLRELQNLGQLCYAAVFEQRPEKLRAGEVKFGGIYLGQTMRMEQGRNDFTGKWWGGEGVCGQLSMYFGVGDNIEYLAYYPSMVISEPSLAQQLPKGPLGRRRPLKNITEMNEDQIKSALQKIEYHIFANERLRQASLAGERIMKALNP